MVALTDGANNALSLKATHIGVAMSAFATPNVARAAASIVLLDDDFGSMDTTIRLGHRISATDARR